MKRRNDDALESDNIDIDKDVEDEQISKDVNIKLIHINIHIYL